MATRTKTIQYAFPILTSLVDNTLTTLTQISVYIPETSPSFKRVIATLTCDDIVTAGGGTIGTRTIALRLAAIGYTTITNSNSLSLITGNNSIIHNADFTTYFSTNWTGTSMTCDCQVLIDQTAGTTLGQENVCVTLDVTYDYDDTSTTHIKTVTLPLNAPVTALTSTPTTYDTIPAIGYHLPEGSKVFRNIHVVLRGNEARNTATTDHVLTAAVGAASQASGNYEGGLASDRWFRFVWELTGSWPSTTATQTFQLSDTVGRNNHPQAWLNVTYEFKADAAPTTLTAGVNDSTTTFPVTSGSAFGTAPFVAAVDNEQVLVTSIASNDWTVTRAYNGTAAAAHSNAAVVNPCVMNSVQLLAGGTTGLAGGTTSADYQRFTNRLYIEEPGPITKTALAFNLSWETPAVTAGLNARVGTGSFVAYTDAASVLFGSAGLMIRNDSAFTLARGLNTITADVYRTDAGFTNFLWGMSGFWIVNYISSKSAAGHGAHNHTVHLNLSAIGTSTTVNTLTVAATAPAIPESDYYLQNVGIDLTVQSSAANSVSPDCMYAYVERLAAEGGVRWDPLYLSRCSGDGKTGVYQFYGDGSSFFKRWPADTGHERMDLETARRFRFNTQMALLYLPDLWYTYHSCGPFTADGTVTGSAGGTVNVYLHRKSDGQLLKSTSRTGNGAYPQMEWWDNTETLFVDFYEDGTHTARSADGTAAGDP